MPYKLEYLWNNNPRLFKLEFFEDVLAEEIEQALEEIAAIMDRALTPLHVTFDITATTLPENLLDLIIDHRVARHEQCGYFVFINPDKFVHFIAKLIRNKAGIAIEIATSEDDALNFFSEMGIG